MYNRYCDMVRNFSKEERTRFGEKEKEGRGKGKKTRYKIFMLLVYQLNGKVSANVFGGILFPYL